MNHLGRICELPSGGRKPRVRGGAGPEELHVALAFGIDLPPVFQSKLANNTMGIAVRAGHLHLSSPSAGPLPATRAHDGMEVS
jgi:hypothetical protein